MPTHAAFRRVFVGVMVAMFLAAADQTILASALPTISSALGGFADLSWVVVAYLLAATVAAPLYGYMGDRFGRRRALLGALAVFTLASCGCALAPTFWWLVVFRALQGLGGGGLMTLAQALIGEHVAPRERGRYAGYFATVFALASTSGPVLGAYLTEHLSWRAVFFVNLPLGLLAAVLALRIPHHAPPRRAGPFRPDAVGAILFCIATASLLFGLSSGGHRYPWISQPMATLIAVTVVAFFALAWWERRHHDPVIPIHFFKIAAIARADAVVLCFGATLFAVIIYLPLYLQLGRGLGIGASGLLLMPITLAQVTSAAVTGRLVTHTGHVTIFPIIGLSLVTLALVGLAIAVVSAPTVAILALTVFVGLGLGMVMPPTQVAVQTAAGRGALGVATGSISLCRAVGGAIGVALVGSVLFALFAHVGDGASTLLREAIEGGTAYVARMSQEQRSALVGRVNDAYRVAFVVLAGIAALGALVATTVPRLDWSKDADPAEES
ncbi:MAG TPA: DHA2 family efflux MFS transporter permease subunit [Casimicrobiaceae bacterium]|nr:DHA2 family efflux MFS transporter permease subunit [Casimicrobiaceae bacterium]